MKRLLFVLIVVFNIELISKVVFAAYSQEASYSNYPDIDAKSAICIEANSGRILYYKNPFSKSYIASTTKIMTAILALENGNIEEFYEVSNEAAHTEGSVMGLKKGEKIKLKDLLYGLMLKSGNDAAVAIAQGLKGDVSSFAESMNQKAYEIGLKDTHFVTPNGLHNDEHYSTAYDMAILSRYALQNNEFSRIVKTKNISFGSKNLVNTNPFLEYYNGVDGVKTGYTSQAGRCIVISATRENMKVITVILNCNSSKTRLESGKRIMDYVFSNFKQYKLATKGTVLAGVPVIKGKKPIVYGCIEEDFTVPLTQKEKENIVETLDVERELKAPINEKEKIGVVKFALSGDFEKTLMISTTENVFERKTIDFFYEIFTIWIKDLVNHV
jgi:D-alanyl-D-alanine carboxypeptidase (penicillin-binding protein 5/6)